MSLLGLSFHDQYGGRTGFWYFCRAALIAVPLIALIMAAVMRS